MNIGVNNVPYITETETITQRKYKTKSKYNGHDDDDQPFKNFTLSKPISTDTLTSIYLYCKKNEFENDILYSETLNGDSYIFFLLYKYPGKSNVEKISELKRIFNLHIKMINTIIKPYNILNITDDKLRILQLDSNLSKIISKIDSLNEQIYNYSKKFIIKGSININRLESSTLVDRLEAIEFFENDPRNIGCNYMPRENYNPSLESNYDPNTIINWLNYSSKYCWSFYNNLGDTDCVYLKNAYTLGQIDKQTKILYTENDGSVLPSNINNVLKWIGDTKRDDYIYLTISYKSLIDNIFNLLGEFVDRYIFNYVDVMIPCYKYEDCKSIKSKDKKMGCSQYYYGVPGIEYIPPRPAQFINSGYDINNITGKDLVNSELNFDYMDWDLDKIKFKNEDDYWGKLGIGEVVKTKRTSDNFDNYDNNIKNYKRLVQLKAVENRDLSFSTEYSTDEITSSKKLYKLKQLLEKIKYIMSSDDIWNNLEKQIIMRNFGFEYDKYESAEHLSNKLYEMIEVRADTDDSLLRTTSQEFAKLIEYDLIGDKGGCEDEIDEIRKSTDWKERELIPWYELYSDHPIIIINSHGALMGIENSFTINGNKQVIHLTRSGTYGYKSVRPLQQSNLVLSMSIMCTSGLVRYEPIPQCTELMSATTDMINSALAPLNKVLYLFENDGIQRRKPFFYQHKPIGPDDTKNTYSVIPSCQKLYRDGDLINNIYFEFYDHNKSFNNRTGIYIYNSDRVSKEQILNILNKVKSKSQSYDSIVTETPNLSKFVYKLSLNDGISNLKSIMDIIGDGTYYINSCKSPIDNKIPNSLLRQLSKKRTLPDGLSDILFFMMESDDIMNIPEDEIDEDLYFLNLKILYHKLFWFEDERTSHNITKFHIILDKFITLINNKLLQQ
tara:strand:- start:211 stop:2895 length:2685 start_codon:yes stop_codon:yes gene_type:complete